MESEQGEDQEVKSGTSSGEIPEVINNVILVDFWYVKLHWREGMVPSIWKQGVGIPVPKKRSKGPCVTDDIHGISLVSVPYKAMCMIVKEKLTLAVEGKLIAAEQGCLERAGNVGTRS